MKFTVKWEVHYYDKDIKLYCDIDQDEDHVKTKILVNGKTYHKLLHRN